jgi:DNA polymerase III epsilon subunit-like protein
MYICLDLETTGLNSKTDHVIEVAIVRFDHSGLLEEWTSLVRPSVPIPAFTEHLTGINDEMVKDAPTLEELKETILEKLGDEPIMGHFIRFDVGFLQAKGFELNNVELDSCQLAQVLLHKEPSYSLEVLAKKLGITQDDAHRAMDDVKANIELVWRMNDHIRALTPDQKASLKPIFQKSVWPWASHFESIMQEEGGSLIEATQFQAQVESESHVNLSKLTENLESPFLFEEVSYTDLDLFNYALNLEGNSLLSVSDTRLMPEHADLKVLKHAHEYLDQERLKRFLQKEQLSDYETMLAAKVSLWLSTTKTGDRSELRLIKEENLLWGHMCSQDQSDADSFYGSAYNKAQEAKVMLISHQDFLKDRSKKHASIELPPHIVIGGIEALSQELERAWLIRVSEERFMNDLRKLKMDHPAQGEVLDHIASKIAILFGFLGMVIKTQGEPNDPFHTLIVEAFHRNTLEWNKVVMSAESIQSAMAALGNEIEQSPILEEFENYLNYAVKILNTSGPILWMKLDMNGEVILHAFPEKTTQIFQERIWNTESKLHFFCHHGNLNDEFAFLIKELGLPENLITKESESIMPLPLSVPERPMSSPNDPKNTKEVCHEIKQRLPDLQGNTFLLVSSKNSAEQFFYGMKDTVANCGRKIFAQNLGGGMGKILKMSQETDGHNFYIGNEYFMNFLLNEGVELSFLALHRIPFSHPNAPIPKARSKNCKNAYKEFTLPQASLSYQRILHRFLGNTWQKKSILVLDPRLGNLL